MSQTPQQPRWSGAVLAVCLVVAGIVLVVWYVRPELLPSPGEGALILTVSVAGFLLVLGILWAHGSSIARMAEERQEALRQQALRLGFSFQADGQALLAQAFTNLPAFSHRDAQIENVMMGSVGATETLVFDYKARRHKGDYLIQRSVAAFQLRDVVVPQFRLRRRIFSRRYKLSGTGQTAAPTPSQERILDVLRTKTTKWYIDGEGHWILLWRGRQEPADLSRFLAEATEVFGHFGIR